MAAVPLPAAVLLIHLTVTGTGTPCSDVLTVQKTRTYKKMTSLTVFKCAAECLASSFCASFNFDLETKVCSQRSDGITPLDVVSRLDNLKRWPKSSSGIQRARFPRVQMCGLSWSYNRVARDCGEPPDVFGSAKVSKHHRQGAVTNYTCQSDFISCDKKTYKTSLCQTSGLWEYVSAWCERFRWTNPVS
ncbi:uncharacterized protein LOC125381592 [Haliotis rufescens]|uniref:uncharacterized protein LOC125381591 n=1 Tax=Haliotis rufescens TaxID=6454 RepID=UPI00201F8117|nr:uncharacterized protein LOC125381591 [Haliotis rufescens]XP_048254613.1 uncharacterized protein LOC125381592 [Haliotis rufescens]